MQLGEGDGGRGGRRVRTVDGARGDRGAGICDVDVPVGDR